MGLMDYWSPAKVGPRRSPSPSPVRNRLNNSGTLLPSRTSEQDEYIAAIIGPLNNPRATTNIYMYTGWSHHGLSPAPQSGIVENMMLFIAPPHT